MGLGYIHTHTEYHLRIALSSSNRNHSLKHVELQRTHELTSPKSRRRQKKALKCNPVANREDIHKFHDEVSVGAVRRHHEFNLLVDKKAAL